MVMRDAIWWLRSRTWWWDDDFLHSEYFYKCWWGRSSKKCGLNITIRWRIMIYLQWSQWIFVHCKYQDQHLHVANSTVVVEDEEADLIIFPSCLVPQGRGVTSTHFRLLMMINKVMMAIIFQTFINEHTSHERWMAIIQWILEMQVLRIGK